MRTPVLHLLHHLPFHFPKALLLTSTCVGLLMQGFPGFREVVTPPAPKPALVVPLQASVRVIVPKQLPAHAPRLSHQQIRVLRMATRIGNRLGMGTKLAAVAFQESGLGLAPVSPAHYGVGSVGYSALQTVLQEHPKLTPYFQNQNWATALIAHPRLSLWVAGYYLQHCYQVAHGDWRQALNLYRYGYGTPGPYASRIQHREAQLRPYLEQL